MSNLKNERIKKEKHWSRWKAFTWSFFKQWFHITQKTLRQKRNKHSKKVIHPEIHPNSPKENGNIKQLKRNIANQNGTF